MTRTILIIIIIISRCRLFTQHNSQIISQKMYLSDWRFSWWRHDAKIKTRTQNNFFSDQWSCSSITNCLRSQIYFDVALHLFVYYFLIVWYHLIQKTNINERDLIWALKTNLCMTKFEVYCIKKYYLAMVAEWAEPLSSTSSLLNPQIESIWRYCLLCKQACNLVK